jgi:phosphoglycerate dehydrogenase-like enzyme
VTEISVQLELTPAQQTRLEVAVDGARLSYGDAIGTAEIVFGNPDPAQITSAEHLRWVQLESVGFGEYLELDWGSINEKIALTNLAGFFAEPVAESALAGILALMRGVNELVTLQDRREWIGDPLRAKLRVLGGARVTMLGRGAINRRLGELLAPFGCSITQLGTDLAPDQLNRELPATEVFVAAVPDTPETRGMMDERRIGLLPSSAFFVNLGRGSLVVEPALVKALNSGRLAGALLDVTEHEPLDPEDPLWTCPNTILTQHTGGGTRDEVDRKIDHFLANLARYRRGDALIGTVDMRRGY